GGSRQNDDEFSSAVTGHGVDFAHVLHQDGGDVAKHLVAYVVAEGIVKLFEVIDVDHQQREVFPPSLRAFELQVQLLLEVTARAQTGEEICKRIAQKAFARVLTGK